MKIINIIRQSTAAALFLAAISFAGCGKDNPGNEKDPEKEPVKVSGVSLNKSTLALAVDASETLAATVAPDSIENQTVTWKSDKPAVDAEGKVTAVEVETAVITVTTDDGNKTASCAVTMNKPEPMTMTMTTAKKGEMEIMLAGTGTATIYWSDGSTPETVNLLIDLAEYTYSFSGTTPRTITIDGKFITVLDCRVLKLTTLDVSKNIALTMLYCQYNRSCSARCTITRASKW